MTAGGIVERDWFSQCPQQFTFKHKFITLLAAIQGFEVKGLDLPLYMQIFNILMRFNSVTHRATADVAT